jgi:hypothetical protein
MAPPVSPSERLGLGRSAGGRDKVGWGLAVLCKSPERSHLAALPGARGEGAEAVALPQTLSCGILGHFLGRHHVPGNNVLLLRSFAMFFFAVLGFELRACTLSHSTALFVLGIF